MKLCMVGAWGHSIYTLESLGDLPEMELAGLYSGDANPPSYLLDEAKKLLTAHLTHDAKRRTPRLQPFAELVRCGHCNGAMTVRQTVKTKNRQYCYYICNEDTKRNVRICPTPRLPAEEFESLVLREIAKVLKKPTMLAEIDRRLGEDDNGRSIRQEVMMTLVAKLEQMWEVMVPTERYSLIHKIVSRIVVFEDRLRVEFNRDGVVKLLQEAGMETVNE